MKSNKKESRLLDVDFIYDLSLIKHVSHFTWNKTQDLKATRLGKLGLYEQLSIKYQISFKDKNFYKFEEIS